MITSSLWCQAAHAATADTGSAPAHSTPSHSTTARSAPAQSAPAQSVPAGAAAGAVHAEADIVGIGLNSVSVLLNPGEQKALLQGGAVVGAAYGAQLCIGAGYGDIACAAVGLVLGAALVGVIADKISPTCSLQVTLDWKGNLLAFSYPVCAPAAR
jgi:hypothetical protein